MPSSLLFLVVIITAVLFSKATSFELLEFDDQLHLTANPFIQPDSPDRFSHFWRQSYGKLYVPITYNLWAIVYARCFDGQTGQFDASLLHGLNIATHALNSGLVFLVVLRLSRGSTRRPGAESIAAALGALLFAIHPLQVESVAWVAEFRGLLAAIFGLIAWRIHLAALDTRTRSGEVLFETVAAIAFAAALLSKPSAAALPLMVATADWLLLRRPLKQTALRLAPWFALTLACLLAMRLLQASGANYGGPLFARPVIAIDSLVFYLGKFAWPLDLSADYSRTTRYVLSTTDIWWLWIIPAWIAALLYWKPSRIALAGAAIFVLALLPVLGLVPFEFQRLSTVADRYAYLALIGPAFGLAFLIRRQPSLAAIAIPVLVLLAWTSHRQLGVWHNDMSLWTHAAQVNPRAIIANANLAVVAGERGDVKSSRALFERVIALDPARSNGYIGIGSLVLNAGDPMSSLDWFDKAAQAEPHLADPHFYAADALLAQGKTAEAEERTNKAFELEPDSVEAIIRVAGFQIGRGDLDNASTLVDRALDIHPRYVSAWIQRATIREKRNDTKGYIDAMNQAARFAGHDTTPIDALGRFAMKIQDWNAAIECFDRSLQIAPGHVPILVELGTALARSGQLDRAADVLERALRLAPDSTVIQNNLRSIRILKDRQPSSTPTHHEQ